MSLRIRRGTDTQRSSIVFDPGELAWCLDTRKLYVGDGVTPGGVNVLANMAGVGVSFNSGTQALDFSQGNLTLTTANIAEDPSRLYYTDVRAKDAVGAMLQAGSNTGITFSYDSSSQAITVNSTGHQLPTASLPGDAGKYLTLDNSGNPVWHNPPIQGGLSLPSFGGTEIGKYLTTDGTYLVWADIAINSLVNGAFHVDLDSAGNLKTSGTIKLPSTADIVRETGVSTGIYTSVLGGLGSVSADTSPSLGGNLSAGGYNISNVGTLSATTVSTGTISATTGLGANLSAGGYNISNVGTLLATTVSTGTTITSTLVSTNIVGTNGGAITMSAEQQGVTIKGSTSTGTTQGAQLIFNNSRGTVASPSSIQAGDWTGSLQFRGYTGYTGGRIPDGFSLGGIISVIQDNSEISTSSGYIGSYITFNAASNTGLDFTKAVVINSDGVLLAPILMAGSYDTNNYPSSPLAGQIIFDSTTKHFMGYNGTNWVAFVGP
jgi:Major tropism determinant N-terminal domain